MKHPLKYLVIGAAIAATSGVASADKANPETLRVALLPDESPQQIIKKNKPFETYLEEELGKEVKLVVTTDYSSMMEAARFDRVDLAYFGPLSYVLASKKGADIVPFAAKMENGEATYRSVLIANRNADVDAYADIEGKTMAYGDPASTSSHLIPKKHLIKQGVEPSDYEGRHTGSHDAVATAVQNGHAQAGALSEPIFESLVERGIVSKDKVKVLGHSEPYPQYPWAMQTYLADDLQAKIRETFLSVDDPAILEPMGAEKLVAISDEDYAPVRELLPLLER
jgi:phosphonate transport system substrate-binding protein